MKKLILLFALFICFSSSTQSEVLSSTGFIIKVNLSDGIDNGWYEATVKYYNYSTYTRSTYTLNVYVEYDRVTQIDFGNGGSIHSGYNNSGYTYSGGYLSFERDYNYNVVGASTTVKMFEENGNTVTFDITIG